MLIKLFPPVITKHRQVSDCKGILQQLHDILQKINPTVQADSSSTPAAEKRSIVQRVMEFISSSAWPLSKDDTNKLLDRLRGHKAAFVFILSAENRFVPHPWAFCYCVD